MLACPDGDAGSWRSTKRAPTLCSPCGLGGRVQSGRHCARPRLRSLNRPCRTEPDAAELIDTLGAPDTSVDRVADHDALRRGIRVLPERLRAVLSLRYLDELTQSQIAEKLGISQMHVSRLISRALSTLRQHMEADEPIPVAEERARA